MNRTDKLYLTFVSAIAIALTQLTAPPFALNQAAASVAAGRLITATAAGPGNNTLRFSHRIQAKCGYAISPAIHAFDSAGGEASFDVTAPAGCDWVAVESESWITITSAGSGNGSGIVSYLVRDNLAPSARQGTITVAGLTHTVAQAGRAESNCNYTIFPAFEAFGPGAGSGFINVTTGGACAWEAKSDAGWIEITSGSGLGSGIVKYSVAANPIATDRNGTITVAGLSLNIKQARCTQFTELAKVIESAGETNDYFSYSIAMSGDTFVVGDVNDDTPAGVETGAAYVYVRDGANLVGRQRVVASDAAPFHLLGHSVAISGDTIVVGARDATGATAGSAGAAYVFVRQGGVWTEQQKLTAFDGAFGDLFGYYVAIDGDTIVVGAPGDDIGANPDSGSAHVFVRHGGFWSFQEVLTASDGRIQDLFGISVALEGNRAVVGAYGSNTEAGLDAGSAYVFERAETVWSARAKLIASDAAQGDFFGWSVALSGSRIVAGAYNKNGGRGSAYVFEESGSSWIQRATLNADGGASGDRFGYRVAISGNRLVVGADLADPFSIMDAGAAYVFDRNGAAWNQTQRLTANDAVAGDEFGFSVAINADSTVVVGAVGDDGFKGSAYLFGGCGAPLPFTFRPLPDVQRSGRPPLK